MDDLNPLAGTAHLLTEVDSKFICMPDTTNSKADDFMKLIENFVIFIPIEKLMVLLRDGRTLIGYLRSVDQFANLVLHKTIERIHVGTEYGDIERGIFIIRGENVVLLGEIDRDKEKNLPLKEVSVEDILDSQRREQEQRYEKHRLISKALKERGLNVNTELTHEEY